MSRLIIYLILSLVIFNTHSVSSESFNLQCKWENKNNFPWLQEYYPWVAEANDNFSTIQKTEGCLAKHLYNETYRIEDV